MWPRAFSCAPLPGAVVGVPALLAGASSHGSLLETHPTSEQGSCVGRVPAGSNRSAPPNTGSNETSRPRARATGGVVHEDVDPAVRTARLPASPSAPRWSHAPSTAVDRRKPFASGAPEQSIFRCRKTIMGGSGSASLRASRRHTGSMISTRPNDLSAHYRILATRGGPPTLAAHPRIGIGARRRPPITRPSRHDRSANTIRLIRPGTRPARPLDTSATPAEHPVSSCRPRGERGEG